MKIMSESSIVTAELVSIVYMHISRCWSHLKAIDAQETCLHQLKQYSLILDITLGIKINKLSNYMISAANNQQLRSSVGSAGHFTKIIARTLAFYTYQECLPN